MIEVGKTKLQVVEFNGTYSLEEGWIDKEGTFKPQWILRKFKKEEGWLDRPLRIPLGTKDTARENLVAIYREIYGDTEVPF